MVLRAVRPAPRLLVVADPDDAGAWRVVEVLAGRHGHAVRGATATDLAFAGRVEYRAEGGRVDAAITLADDTPLDPRELRVVLFRAAGTAAPWAARASPADGEYAATEAFALLLAWLAALPGRVVNAPTGSGLSGPARTPVQWLASAARAGLPIPRMRATTDARTFPMRAGELVENGGRSAAIPVGRRAARFREPVRGPETRVLVTDGRPHRPLPAALLAPCAELARTSGCGLLALTVAADASGPLVTAVDPVPRLDGPGEVEAVAGLIEHFAAA
jgi:hypothetical protein